MPRATTKNDLINSANLKFDKLLELIKSMSEEEQTTSFLFDDRDKNVRDVLVHLYEWHKLLLEWEKNNSNGIEKPFLPSPYNWKTYPQMNIGFWEKHQSTPYEKSREILQRSHRDVMAVIEKYSDVELFTKKHFTWTGTTSLGQYCVSATASHYDWAMEKLKKHIKAYREEKA